MSNASTQPETQEVGLTHLDYALGRFEMHWQTSGRPEDLEVTYQGHRLKVARVEQHWDGATLYVNVPLPQVFELQQDDPFYDGAS